MSASVLEGFNTCGRILKKVATLLSDPQLGRHRLYSNQINDESERLGLWIGQHDALHSPESSKSLEFRLHEAKDVLSHIIGLLDDLQEVSEDLLRSVAEPKDYNDEAHDSKNGQELVEEVRACVTRLFKASSLIEQAVSNHLADKLVSQNQNIPANQHDILYVGLKYPKLAEEKYSWLRQRLGYAITQRRVYLAHIRDNQKDFEAISIQEHLPISWAIITIRPNKGTEKRAPRGSDPILSEPSNLPDSFPIEKKARQELLSAEDAMSSESGLPSAYAFPDPAPLGPIDNLAVAVIPSTANHVLSPFNASGIPHFTTLRQVSPGKIQCPFCFRIGQFENNDMWLQHVFSDLRPYICTFRDCRTPVFDDATQWFRHEMRYHRAIFQCSICEDYVSRSLDNFRHHLQSYHDEQLQLLKGYEDVLLDVSRKPVETILAQECPCCERWTSNDHNFGKPAEFKLHLASHLEDLALFSISPSQFKNNEFFGADFLNSAVNEFFTFVEGTKQLGERCDGTPDHYISRIKTRGYWNIVNASSIIGTVAPNLIPHTEVTASELRIHGQPFLDRYSIIFSILVYLSSTHGHDKIALIEELLASRVDDTRIPLGYPPAHLGHLASSAGSLWEDFRRAQWMFCPVSIGQQSIANITLGSRAILPISTLEYLDQERKGNSKLRKVQLHSDSGENSKSTFVFKTLELNEANDFHSEMDHFTLFANATTGYDNFHKSVIRYFGSFTWTENAHKKHTMVFEFARRTLADLLKTGKPPKRLEHVKNFWERMLGILKGMVAWQEHVCSQTDELHCSHPEIRPEAVMVDYQNSEFSRYRTRYTAVKRVKLADIDLGHDQEQAGSRWDAYPGTGTYGCPEREYAQGVRCKEKRNDDIWAVSCLFLELAVWLTAGEICRLKFKDMRKREIVSTMPDTYPDCPVEDSFHDGTNVLECVKDVPNWISEHSQTGLDRITRSVVIETLRGVLCRAEDKRLNAAQLLYRLERAKDQTWEVFRSRRTPKVKFAVAVPETSNDGEWTLSQLPACLRRVMRRPRTMRLPDQLQIAIHLVADRDIIMVFDNSNTMQRHKSDVMEDGQRLARHLKTIQKRSMELYCTSPRSRRTIERVSQINQFFGENFPTREPKMDGAEQRLVGTMKHIFKIEKPPYSFDPFKPTSPSPGISNKTSIYVFTDGVWGGSAKKNGSEASRITKFFTNVLQPNWFSRGGLFIQFIRYGNDEVGKRNLQLLDDMNGPNTDNTWDNVSHSSRTDSLASLLIGDIVKENHDTETYDVRNDDIEDSEDDNIEDEDSEDDGVKNRDSG